MSRQMRTVQVQLDINKDEQELLYDEIEKIKQAREFTQVFIDAFRLILDLRDGHTVVLFELFPELKEKLAGDTSNGDEYVSKREFDLLKQLVDTLMQEKMQAPAKDSTSYQMVEQPLPPANAPAFAGTKTNGKSDGNAANNLLASLDNF